MDRVSAEDVVIGSGPCGFSSVKAIIDSGRHPLVIDFGPDPIMGSVQIEKAATFAMKNDVGRTRVFDSHASL